MSTTQTRNEILKARRAVLELLAQDDQQPVLGPSLRATLQAVIDDLNDRLYLARQQRTAEHNS